MSERAVKVRVKRLLESYGKDVWFHMPYMTGMGRAGIPDFTICCKGHFIAVETKAEPSSKPTPMQARELAAINEAGGTSMIVHSENIQDLAAILNHLTERV